MLPIAPSAYRAHAAKRACQPVEIAPSGPQWLHEIKLDGFRMSARIESGRVQLLTRTGLDWSDKYPGVIAALSNVRANSAYLDGELCGVGDDGLPSFSQTQAGGDGERGVRLVYYAFDLLHLDGRNTASLPLIERKALLQPLIADNGSRDAVQHALGHLAVQSCRFAILSPTIDAKLSNFARNLGKYFGAGADGWVRKREIRWAADG